MGACLATPPRSKEEIAHEPPVKVADDAGVAKAAAGSATSSSEVKLGLSDTKLPSSENIEEAKLIYKEAFVTGLQRVLEVAISGYPKALRSTASRRNELLREFNGDQDAAVEKVSEMASDLREEGKTWVLGLVPYIGLPASILYPTWMALRRICLLAGVYGLDLESEQTQAHVLHVFAGVGSVPTTEWLLEAAAQKVWEMFAGPVAGMLPVGALVSKVANVEGHVVNAVGAKEFDEFRQEVPADVYRQMLDPEPTMKDYLELAKQGSSAALYAAYHARHHLMTEQARENARGSAVAAGTAVAQKAAAVGKVTAAAAADLGKAATDAATSKALETGAKAKGSLLGAGQALADKATALSGGAKDTKTA